MKHWILIRVGTDVFLMALIAFNFYAGWKLRKALKKRIAQLDACMASNASVVVPALDRMAKVVCPLCAVAAGIGTLQSADGGGELIAETEENGEHVIYQDGRQGTTECLAAKIHADARQLFATSMQGKAA